MFVARRILRQQPSANVLLPFIAGPLMRGNRQDKIPCEGVCTAASPEGAIAAFVDSTYGQAARLAGCTGVTWNGPCYLHDTD